MTRTGAAATLGMGMLLATILPPLGAQDLHERAETQFVNHQIGKLKSALNESAEFSERIASGIPDRLSRTVLDPRKSDAELVKAVTGFVDRGLAEVGMERTSTAPMIERLDGGAIAKVRFGLPDLPVGGTDTRRQKSSVMVWVCDTRSEAVALFWLRRRGPVPGEAFSVEQARLGPWTQTRAGGDHPGEVSYRLHNQADVSVALPLEALRSGTDRIGLLQDNLLIEATGSTFSKGSDGRWLTSGMTGEDERVLFELLAAIHAALPEPS